MTWSIKHKDRPEGRHGATFRAIFCDVKLKFFSTTISTTLRFKIARKRTLYFQIDDIKKVLKPLISKEFQDFFHWQPEKDSNPHKQSQSQINKKPVTIAALRI